MNNIFKFDFTNKTIVGTKTAINKANTGNTKEYRELCQKLAEHPDFKVVQKEIDTNKNKKKYNGLTFDKMKEYILTQPDSENKLIEFDKVKDIAEAKCAKYPLTKKWFLNTYPEYKENATSVAEIKAEKIASADHEEIAA